MNIERILVPVDFSHHANAAMRLAISLANRWRSRITVLHVDPLPGMGTVAVEPIYIAPQVFEGLHAEHDASVEKNLREICDDFAPRAVEGVVVEAERRRGEAVEGIVEFAREEGIDLIVMGSQGVSGFTQLLLGSVADKVSRTAPCPVLIAGRDDDTREDERSLRRVIVAVDYSRFSMPVARMAAALTAPGGTLELLHVWTQPYYSALSASLGGEHEGVRGMIDAGRQAEAARIEAFAAELDRSLAESEVEVVQYIGTGTSAMAILERAEEVSADLIALGAHGRSGLDERLLGTVADRVLRHARMPVLLYPEGALSDQD
jgi:nucleotide-binding universal stress UspA family protein